MSRAEIYAAIAASALECRFGERRVAEAKSAMCKIIRERPYLVPEMTTAMQAVRCMRNIFLLAEHEGQAHERG